MYHIRRNRAVAETKEYITQSEEMGHIHISEEVIAAVAAVSAAEVEGVSGLSANLGTDIAELLGVKNLSRGIKLLADGEQLVIDVAVLVKYGYAITEVAKHVQDAVMNGVSAMTGLSVTAVNVHVGGVTMDKVPKKQREK
jgi:uncharacterized alkaline shock family protein YloU